MIGIVGKVRVSEIPLFTRYFWGDISEIAGKELDLIERNKDGDCMCILHGKGLVDVDHRDVVRP